MTTYTTRNYSISTFEALHDCLVKMGAKRPIISMSGSLKVTANISEAAIITAIAGAAPGSLESVRENKLLECIANTTNLLALGVESWVTGHFVELSEAAMDKLLVITQFYTANPSEISSTDKYIIQAIEGDIVSTALVRDIDALAKDTKHRLDYIYMSLVPNSDASCSEMLLRGQISAAATIAEVNAIVDTRV